MTDIADYCMDNRFEVIERYKRQLIESTNIETNPDEMAVIDGVLFRFWQMGWLVPDTNVGDMTSKQAVIDVLENVDCSDGVGISALKCDAIDDAITVIKTLPTVDAVPVVRCKDCLHNRACEIQYHAQAGDLFFCGAAERKDGDDNG